MKKNKKIVSILLTLAFLASFIVPSAAFAADAAEITGTYKFVKAETEQAAGSVKLAKDDAFKAGEVEKVYYEVNLPDGVEITDGAAANVSGLPAGASVTASGVSGTIDPAAFDGGATTISFNKVDIDSDVTGNVVAEAKVWGFKAASGVVWEVSSNVTIAKINSGDVTISVGDPEAVSVGAAQKGAKVTIKETTPGALAAGDEIFVTILTSGVKWDEKATAYTDSSKILGSADFTSEKIVKLKVATPSSGAAAKLELVPAFLVTPGTTGDVKLKVSGDVETTEAVVAKVGASAVEVTTKDADSKIFIGSEKTLDVEVTLDPQTKFKNEDYFTLTLPKGFKWTSCTDNSALVELKDATIDGDRTAWFVFNGDESAKIKLSNLKIKADYNAPVGDVKVTAAGAVKGDVVIGKAVAPLTITADKVNLPLKGNNVAGGKITIVEADGGAVANGAQIDLTLPMGATFAKLPTVEVTDGDLDLDGTEVEYGDDKSTILINVNEASNVASTIVLTGLSYNVDNRASTGDLLVSFGEELNTVSDNALGSFSAGAIIGENASKSTFVIGSTSYTVNGETKTLDSAPYIKDDRTFLPLRFVATAAGVSDENIVWNAADQSVVIIKGDRIVKLNIGSKTMYVNGIAVNMDTAPEITNSRTMLPVRWVAQALGAVINWDATTKTVTVEVK